MRVISNILWIILGGLIIAIGWALIGLVLCVTIIGIPLGLQAFKMAGLTLTPFGKTVRYGGGVGDAGQHHLGRARRLLDGAQLRGRRPAELHHDHRHPVRHPVVQDGETGALAVRRGHRQPVSVRLAGLIRRSAYTVPSSR